MSYALREYQQDAIAGTWRYLCNEPGNPVIVAPTGAGKSIICADLARGAIESNLRVMVLAHRKELLQQNAAKIKALVPGASVGIYSAGLGERTTDADIVLAGIQSCFKRAFEFDQRHLIIIDECHLVPSSDDGMYRQFLADMSVSNPNSRVVGLTATPYRLDSGLVYGPDQIFAGVSHQIEISGLIRDGYLSPVVSRPVTEIDTSGLHHRGGEFIRSEMESLFDAHVIDACRETVEIANADNRRHVLVFASGVQHAIHASQIIADLTGEMVSVVTGDTLPLERAAILEDFANGGLRWLINVDVLCLSEDTEILTSDGWTVMDEMTEDHLIASWDFDESIVFEKPKLIVRRKVNDDEKFATLKTNGTDIKVTDNHRMVVWQGSDESGKWVIKQARDIVGKPVKMPAHGTAKPFEFDTKRHVDKKTKMSRVRSLSYSYRKRLGMGYAETKIEAEKEVDRRIELKHQKNPRDLTESECELIGFWVGDGTRSCGRFSITQSHAYPRNIHYIRHLLIECGIHFTEYDYPPTTKNGKASVRFCMASGEGSRDQSRPGVQHLNEYLDKNGSELLWGLDRNQVLHFLEGLWRADGLHHAKSEYRINLISGANKDLFDLLQAICSCRGIKTCLSKCSPPRKSNHRQLYNFYWNVNATRIATRKGTFELENPSEGDKAWCVTSVTGNIITRRNGKVAVTGNTTGFDAPCIDCVVLMRASESPGLVAQMLGRGFRLSPGKDNFLVLDFGGNLRRHGPIDDPGYGKRSKPKGKGEAPMKVCPACDEEVAAGLRECGCGFRFPEPEINHDPNADLDAAVLKEQQEPMGWEVLEVSASVHTKRGADELTPKTLRMNYEVRPIGDDDGGNLNVQVISEWVCVEHDGFARRKAENWWELRSELPCPYSAEEAVEMFNRGGLADTIRLATKMEGKYHRIIWARLGERPDCVRDEDDSLDIEEVPF